MHVYNTVTIIIPASFINHVYWYNYQSDMDIEMRNLYIKHLKGESSTAWNIMQLYSV